MKTQRFFFATLVLVCAAVFSFAAGPTTTAGRMIVHLNLDGNYSIDLQIANLQQYRTGIHLMDLDGKTWYSEYVWNENGYAVKLDLEGMPDGDYLLFVKNRYDKFVRALTVREKGIALFETQSLRNEGPNSIFAADNLLPEGSLITYFYAPKENQIGVQVANLRNQKLDVQLTNLRGIPAFAEEVNDEMAYAKRFNLEGLEVGDYFLLIRTDEIVQIQFFAIHKTGVELEGRQMLDLKEVDDAFATR